MFSESSTIAVIGRLINPVGSLSALLLVLFAFDQPLDGYYIVLGVIAFFLTAQLFADISLMQSGSRSNPLVGLVGILTAWTMTAIAILFLGYVTQLERHFNPQVILVWMLVTPFLLFAAHRLTWVYIRKVHEKGQARHAAKL